MTKRELGYELARNEMKIADTYRCPNCGSHWIKLVVVGEGVIKGCEMCKARLSKDIKYTLIPFRAYARETAIELLKARGLI
jgi:ribosomal protein L37AE/L43A